MPQITNFLGETVVYQHSGEVNLPAIALAGADGEEADLIVFGLEITDEKTGKKTRKAATILQGVPHVQQGGRAAYFPCWSSRP